MGDASDSGCSGSISSSGSSSGSSYLSEPLTLLARISSSLLRSSFEGGSDSSSSCDDDPHSDSDVGEDVLVSYSMLIMMGLLGLTVFIGHVVKTYKFKHAPESLMAIIGGALVGLMVRLFPHSADLRDLLSFDPSLFFFVLLPPIIFSSGYTMQRETFFKHLGSILTFAIPGTMMATFFTGLLFYAVTIVLPASWMSAGPLSLIDCLIFGALISATDPVSVLSVFHSLNVEPHMFALVFGESILNDAVAIVLFDALREFAAHEDESNSAAAFTFAVLGALVIFVGSLVIGVLTALLSALVFKHVSLHTQPMLEASTFIIFAYTSYLSAQAVGASGIVSMLFCGIGMAHYAAPNLSPKTRLLTKGMFSLLAFLAETFTFVYIGVTLAARDDYLYIPALIIGAFIAIIISRALCIFPLSWTINIALGHPWTGKIRLTDRDDEQLAGRRAQALSITSDEVEDEIQRRNSHESATNLLLDNSDGPTVTSASSSMTSSLGASSSISSLSSTSSTRVKERKAVSNAITPPKQVMLWWSGLRGAMAFALAVRLENAVILTTTLSIVLLTVAVFGGFVPMLLERLRIPMQPNAPPGTGEEDEERWARREPRGDGWFQSMDHKYLIPFFSRARPLADGPSDESQLMMMVAMEREEEEELRMEEVPREEDEKKSEVEKDEERETLF